MLLMSNMPLLSNIFGYLHRLFYTAVKEWRKIIFSKLLQKDTIRKNINKNKLIPF